MSFLKNILSARNGYFYIFFISTFIILTTTGLSADKKNHSIGILLPLSGKEKANFREVLEWAASKVNQHGGLEDTKVKLVFKDTGKDNLHNAAIELLNDPNIKVVIGPNSSSDVFELAPIFIKNKKLLISPTATSTDIYRAFAGKKYFWRTCQGDIGQIKTILHLLKQKGAKKIALLSEETSYGNTFFDWVPFFCFEMQLELLKALRYPPQTENFGSLLDQLLKNSPDYIIVAATSKDAVAIVRELKKKQNKAKLFFTDAVQTPYLLKKLGSDAENLEGAAPALNPESDFEKKYFQRFHEEPFAYAATTWDAFLLAIYTLSRNHYQEGDEPIHESLEKVISGQDTKICWNEIPKGIKSILSGDLPNSTGATGKLEFDNEFGVDPLDAYYSHWIVKNGHFTIKKRLNARAITGGIVPEQASIARTRGSDTYGILSPSPKKSETSTPHKGLQAVILASSSGWKNYRHQADALAFYQYLKESGVKDRDIILFLTNDLVNHDQNPRKGVIQHNSEGKNLNDDVIIDYCGPAVNVDNLKNVLNGKQTDNTPEVVRSDSHTNILLYISGHGEPGKILFSGKKHLSEDHLEDIIKNMYKQKKYRRMLIITEVCYGESMAVDISAPGVIYFTGSRKNEQCFGTNYDAEINNWLADDFSYKLLQTVKENPNLSIAEFYTSVYTKVSGSHVHLCNYQNFGNIKITMINEFFHPPSKAKQAVIPHRQK